MKRALNTTFAILVLAWLALTASTYGVLVWQSKAFISPTHARPVVMCTYFEGTKLFERGYIYSPDGRVGHSRCPVFSKPLAF
ncbi:MAG: hypothetical protein KJ622_11560 [Alphaproteobacteria bacterium]|nr:hypothetical protein [Alphaproteobacteria bacterium]